MSTENYPTKTTGTRVFQHPQARIKPLDADTLHEASTCLVYENGQASPSSSAADSAAGASTRTA